MQGKEIFTIEEVNEIRELLKNKVISTTNEQKKIRRKLRDKYQFYISDFTTTNGFTVEDFNELIDSGRIKVTCW